MYQVKCADTFAVPIKHSAPVPLRFVLNCGYKHKRADLQVRAVQLGRDQGRIPHVNRPVSGVDYVVVDDGEVAIEPVGLALVLDQSQLPNGTSVRWRLRCFSRMGHAYLQWFTGEARWMCWQGPPEYCTRREERSNEQ